MELVLRSIAFSMLVGIIGYMLYFIVTWFMAVVMVFQFIFGTMTEGWHG
ncbi:hypothetical protein SEA_MAKAI_4 [Arthrobacter phage Makai]|nr:hypothetical protein SEA_MAKAI_4 [Arthrobacter phage Makai]QPX62468.1 membrane protein [Arthrobacter phage Truckee]